MKRKVKKSEVKVGQCYSYHDTVYMVKYYCGNKEWEIQHTITKEEFLIPEAELVTWRRAFDNNG
jgi:hypothetical protein